MKYRNSQHLIGNDLRPMLRVRLYGEVRSADGATVFPAGALVCVRAINHESVRIWTDRPPYLAVECTTDELRRGSAQVAAVA